MVGILPHYTANHTKSTRYHTKSLGSPRRHYVGPKILLGEGSEHQDFRRSASALRLRQATAACKIVEEYTSIFPSEFLYLYLHFYICANICVRIFIYLCLSVKQSTSGWCRRANRQISGAANRWLAPPAADLHQQMKDTFCLFVCCSNTSKFKLKWFQENKYQNKYAICNRSSSANEGLLQGWGGLGGMG